MNVRGRIAAAVALLAAAVAGCSRPDPGVPAPDGTLRIGHFPNVTHAAALVAHARTRAGRGWFEERLPGTRVEWFVYSAGPDAMGALLAGSLHACYVGPSPALNAYVRTGGDDVRVLAGATRGGAALVVREGSGIAGPEGFRGRRLATPQLGNTQDVAARAWLRAGGLRVTQTGGDALVLPTHNPDQLALFQRGELDGCWTVEPWVSRLVREAKGEVLLEDRASLTTVLVASARFVEAQPDLARKLTAAHRELTAWVAETPEEAKALVLDEIAAETQRPMKRELLDGCWERMRFDDAAPAAEFEEFLRTAQSVGFLKRAGDLGRLVVVER